jgi:ATP diphosphatase
MPDPRALQEFGRLLDIVARLRAPDGCPWDREQTLDSLKRYVLEETYEVLEAIDRADHAGLCEEIGDHVFEGVLLAQVAKDNGHFTIADALALVADKLVRRHPHVFDRDRGEAALETSGEVVTKWDEIKAQERAAKGARASTLDGIPAALPALARADQIGRRAAATGFDWAETVDVVDKMQEEVDELRAALRDPGENGWRVEDELGDVLFTIANLSRKLGVEPEAALRKANDKFIRRFTRMEQRLTADGLALRSMPLADLEEAWQETKRLIAAHAHHDSTAAQASLDPAPTSDDQIRPNSTISER